jgi:hypothetical protein
MKLTPIQKADRARRRETIKGVKAVLALLQKNPEIPMPSGIEYMTIWVSKGADLAKVARHIPGKLEKSASSYSFSLRRQFGPVSLNIATDREQVCVKKLVGKREIPAQTVTTAAYTEDVVEWECPKAIMALVNSTPDV